MAGLEEITQVNGTEARRLSEIFKTANQLGEEGMSAIQGGDIDRGRFLYLRAAEVARECIPKNDFSAQQYGNLLFEFYKDKMDETPKEPHPLND